LDQADLLRKISAALESLGTPYAITGSQASIAYGENRVTNDIDVVADLDLAKLERFLAFFPANEFYASADAARTAVTDGGQFNIIDPTSAQKIDVIIPRDDFDRGVLARACRVSTGAGTARFITPEDLIVKKMQFYVEGASEKHLRDIAGMLLISGQSIDRGYVEQWSHKLGLDDVWKAVQERVKGS
jgi:hypothetical protein